MNRKKIWIALIFAVFIIGVFVLITVTTKSDTGENVSSEEKAENGSTEGSKESDTSSESSEKKAAKEIIGETVSKEEIQKEVGEYEKFDMSSDGCERGVYAGKFYYDKFTIYSRTYDKGKTFHVISVN